MTHCEKPEKIIKVVTLEPDISDISYTTAILKGQLVDIGEAADDHGIMLSIENYPEFGNSTTISLGRISAPRVFSAEFTSLDPYSEYYYKAFVTRGKDIFYGDRKHFSTLDPRSIPTLTTSAISNIGHYGADGGGEITDDGGAAITDRGLCWHPDRTPLISDNFVSAGQGTGTFTCSITGLDPAVDYYVRAYAINAKGTGYGNEINFATVAQGYNVWYPFNNNVEDESGNNAHATNYGALPSFDRFGNSNSSMLFDDAYVDSNDPRLGGEEFTLNLWIYADSLAGKIWGQYKSAFGNNLYCGIDNSSGNLFIWHSETGGNDLETSTPLEKKKWYMVSLVWSASTIELFINGTLEDTNINPGIITQYGNFILGTHSTELDLKEGFNGIIDDVGLYDHAMIEAELNDLYQNNGWTGELLISDYDGNDYKTVHIGQQLWMAENIKSTLYPDGSTIPNIIANTDWGNLVDNSVDDAYCWYNNNPASEYGGLYTYAAAVNICPTGWHLPTDDEWKQLEMYLGMSQSEADGTGLRGTNEGGMLREAGFVHWSSPNNGATNLSGFTALPGSSRSAIDGAWGAVGTVGVFWSDTEYDISNSWYRYLRYDFPRADRSYGLKSAGFSVRCLKD